MFSLIRAVIYATLILALVLFLLPGETLEEAGLARPSATGLMQTLGESDTAALRDQTVVNIREQAGRRKQKGGEVALHAL